MQNRRVALFRPAVARYSAGTAWFNSGVSIFRENAIESDLLFYLMNFHVQIIRQYSGKRAALIKYMHVEGKGTSRFYMR
jgi:hypothetical protein